MPSRSPLALCLRGGGLSRLVFRPHRRRALDIALLTLLGAAAEEDDQGVTVPCEIDPIARPPVDAILTDGADPLHTRQVARFEPHRRSGNFRSSLRVKSLEPSSERIGSVLPNVLDDGQHALISYSNVYVTIWSTSALGPARMSH